MAEVKISALSAAARATGVEKLPVVQGGSTVGMTTAQIAIFGDHPGYRATRWYQPNSAANIAAGAALANGSIRLVPFFVKEPITISDMGCRITTLAASGNIQLAIYAADATSKMPTGTALAVTASISTTTATTVSADITGADVSLPAGFYWMAVNADATAGGTVILQAYNNSAPLVAALIGSTTLADIAQGAATAGLYYSTPSTFGTWGDLTSAVYTLNQGNGFGVVFFKVSSVP